MHIILFILTHHNTIGHKEDHPSKDMNHKEGHWQPTQVIILTATKDIAMACNREKCQKWQIVPCKMAFIVIFFLHLNWLKITQRQICIIHLKIGVLYKNKNKSLYLQLHVPSAPRQGPQPLARSPLLVHLCPEDEECRWGSMGWAVPGTLGTVLQWARAAEGAQIIFSLFTFAILKN